LLGQAFLPYYGRWVESRTAAYERAMVCLPVNKDVREISIHASAPLHVMAEH